MAFQTYQFRLPVPIINVVLHTYFYYLFRFLLIVPYRKKNVKVSKIRHLKKSHPQSLSISLVISLLKWIKQNESFIVVFKSRISRVNYINRTVFRKRHHVCFSLYWFWLFNELDFKFFIWSVGSIAEVPFILINSAFWKYQVFKIAFSEIATLVYILTFPVLKTHGYFGMSWVDKCLYKSQCLHIWRWICI